jgi:hypothetical protein
LCEAIPGDPDKNERLKAGGAISIEEIVAAVEEDGLKDILVHPNQRRYRGQVVLVVGIAATFFLSLQSKRKPTTC